MTHDKEYKELLEKYNWFSCNNADAENFMTYVYHAIVEFGDTVIDVGAHRALHTLPLAKLVGSNGKVYAFEAIPYLAKLLKEKTSDFSVRVINAAVTNSNIASSRSEISFVHIPEAEGLSGIHMHPDVPNHARPVTITVPTTTLDMSIPAGERCSFIKIDTENGDFDVIRGSERILRESKPVIVFESRRQSAADIYGYTKNDFFEFFASFGYTLFTFTGEAFTQEFWDADGIYEEIWAVHEGSKHLSFFENNLSRMALHYVREQKNFTEIFYNSKSYKITAPLRKIMDYYIDAKHLLRAFIYKS